MALKPIALSFKNTQEDMELYAWIISHSNMSGFIKDTLRVVKEREGKSTQKKLSQEVHGTNLTDMDY